MLAIQSITFKRGEDTVFENLDFVVHPGQRCAVVGRNGVGKTTLFSLVRGRLHADVGDVTYPKSWRIGHLAQEVAASERPAIDYVVDGHHELRRVEKAIEHSTDDVEVARLHGVYHDLGGYEAEARAGEILHGLGFASSEFTKPFSAFSGGWRIRLNLAQALMSPSELLLLDEPTNHLDLEATLWLEGWLNRYPGTLMVIAHDREFLDQIATHVLHMTGSSGQVYRGNYSSFERQRIETLERMQRTTSKRRAEARHIQDFVDRFRAKASKARQVQSRLKALEKLQTALPAHEDSPYRVSFPDPAKVSNPLFTFRDLTLGYNGTPVLKGMSQSILPGDRIGVLGANGAGKSTLLKCLVGALPPMAGELTPGDHCQVGYFAQHQLETLNAGLSAMATIAKAAPDQREQQWRDYLGGWGFDKRMSERPVASLSGGEKARLVLALIALSRPAMLVLDEPTNHLDLDFREALAIALQDYAGALVIVSHDRAMLDRTVDQLWVVRNSGLHTYPHDLDRYMRDARDGNYSADDEPASATADSDAPDVSDSSDGTATARSNGAGSTSPDDDARTRRKQAAATREQLRPLKRKADRLEREVDKLTTELKDIEVQLADPDVYHSLPKAKLDALLKEAGKQRRKLEAAELDWLQAAQALENARA